MPQTSRRGITPPECGPRQVAAGARGPAVALEQAGAEREEAVRQHAGVERTLARREVDVVRLQQEAKQAAEEEQKRVGGGRTRPKTGWLAIPQSFGGGQESRAAISVQF